MLAPISTDQASTSQHEPNTSAAQELLPEDYSESQGMEMAAWAAAHALAMLTPSPQQVLLSKV